MIGYFDCYSGIAGDMVIGAMLDAGLPLAHLKRELGKLKLHGYSLSQKIEHRGMIGGVNFQVNIKHGHHHHHVSFKEIRGLIKSSKLNNNVKKISLCIFETLAKAEAHVHRRTVDSVHFHEVGAVDSIVDIVGSAIGFDYFNLDAIYSSPLPVARGFVRCEHGCIPIPAPATLEILKGVPLVKAPVKAELVTPTGAAILKTMVKEFCEPAYMTVKKTGYGLGDKDFAEVPNALRFIIAEGEKMVVIEANIDDMNPQIYDYLIERLMENGAADVTIRPVLMKKHRPGQMVQVLARDSLKDKLIKIILSETTSIGTRYYYVSRQILDREIKSVKTKFGTVRVKISRLGNDILNVSPEYEDCKKLAKAKKVALKDIFSACLLRSGVR